MKFLKWLQNFNNAEAHHGTADFLSNNKTFQKFVLGIYHTPEKISNKLYDLKLELLRQDERLNEEKPVILVEYKETEKKNILENETKKLSK